MADRTETAGEGGAISPPVLRDLVSTVDQVRRQRDRLRSLVEHVPAVLYVDDLAEIGKPEYRTLYVSPQVESMLGVTVEEWTANDELWQQRMHPDDWPRARAEYDDFLGRRRGVLVQEYRFVRPDNGATIWIRDECTISKEKGSGRPVVLGVMLDVTAQKTLEAQLRAAEARNRSLIEQIPHVVWIEPVNGASEPAYVSPSVEKVFGISRAEWLEEGWWEAHLHEDDKPEVLAFREVLRPGAPSYIEYRLHLETRPGVWVGHTSQLLMDGDEASAVQSLLEDITPRKLAQEQLEFQATHDPLTGLANRTLFADSIEFALARAGRRHQNVALLYCDLNDFKAANDTYGHETGDIILQEVARRMIYSVRDTDLVARPGGDEFLVLLPDIDPEEGEAVGTRHRAEELADTIADRIRTSLEAPIETPNGDLVVTMSIGRCTFPWDADDVRSLMTAADAAMYRSKA